MGAVETFQLGAKKAYAAEGEPIFEDLEYDFLDDRGNKRTVVAHFPGESAISMLVITTGTGDGMATISEIFGFLQQSLKSSDYTFIRASYRKGILDGEVLMQLVSSMIEKWSTFPTEPPSGSSPKAPPTGTTSTGRAPGKGSTRSTATSRSSSPSSTRGSKSD